MITAAGRSESWRWQLRDSEGQWIKMGSRVSWLERGRLKFGEVVGSPREGVARVKPVHSATTRMVETRRLTAVSNDSVEFPVEKVVTAEVSDKRTISGLLPSTSAAIDYSTYIEMPLDDPRVAEARKRHGITQPIPPDAAGTVLLRPDWNVVEAGRVVGTVMRIPRKPARGGQRPPKPVDYVGPFHKGLSVRQSHERLAGYRHTLPRLQTATAKDSQTNDAAAISRLLLLSGIRVDAAGGADLSITGRGATYGAQSLQARHVQLLPDGTIRLRFVGKHQRINTRDIKDPVLYKAITARLAGVTDPNQPLFPNAVYTDVASYVRKHLGGQAEVHDLRRNFATQAAVLLKSKYKPPPRTKEEYAAAIADIGQAVAAYINENPKQPLMTYIDPFTFMDWRDAAGIGPLDVHEMENPELLPYQMRPDLKADLMVTDVAQLRKVTRVGPGRYSTLYGHDIIYDANTKKWAVSTPGMSRRSMFKTLDEAKKFIARQQVTMTLPAADFGEEWGVRTDIIKGLEAFTPVVAAGHRGWPTVEELTDALYQMGTTDNVKAEAEAMMDDEITSIVLIDGESRAVTAAGRSESWRWQLRDSEGQWIKMGSRVSWLERGRLKFGEITGSPREGVAKIKPDHSATSRMIEARRLTAVPAEGVPAAKIPAKKAPAAKIPVERAPAAKIPTKVSEAEAKAKMPEAKAKVTVPEAKAKVPDVQSLGQRITFNGKTKYPTRDVSIEGELANLTPNGRGGYNVDIRDPATGGIRAYLIDSREWTKGARIAPPSPDPHGTIGVEGEGGKMKAPREKMTPAQERALIEAFESPVGMVSDTYGIRRSTIQALIRAGLVEGKVSSSRRGATPGGAVGRNYNRVDSTLSATLTEKGREYLRDVLGKDIAGPSKTNPTPKVEVPEVPEVPPSPEPHGTIGVEGEGGKMKAPQEKVTPAQPTTKKYRTVDLKSDVVRGGRGFQGVVREKATGEVVTTCEHSHGNQSAATKCADTLRRNILYPPIVATSRTRANGIEVLSVEAETDAQFRRVKVTPFVENGMQVEGFWLNGGHIQPYGFTVKGDGTLGPKREVGNISPPPNVVAALTEPDPTPKAETPEAKAARIRTLAKETDTRLSEIYQRRLALQVEMARLADTIHRTSGSIDANARNWGARKREWDRSLQEAVSDFRGREYERRNWETARDKYLTAQKEHKALGEEQGRLEVLHDEHGWTRAFLVTNGNGHVHRSMGCSTCFPTTQFAWLPDYSGADEDEIVGDAGERACTVCYPTAPVSVLQRPTKIFSEDERKQIERRDVERAERAKRRAAREAKAITAPDGSPLRVSTTWGSETIKSVVTARNMYVGALADELVARANPGSDQAWRSRLTWLPEVERMKILLALAAKTGEDIESIRSELLVKARQKSKRMARENGLLPPT